MNIQISFLLIFLAISISNQKAKLSNNGYEDILIAISPEIAEDAQIIDNLKILFTEASEELYKATRSEFYASISILSN